MATATKAPAKEDLGQDFTDSPGDQQKRWALELEASKKELKKWHSQGDDVVKCFLDKRDNRSNDEMHITLFSSNVQTMRALLYGKTPQVDVSRRFSDSNDDDARIGAEILERLLNTDIQSDSDSYSAAIEHSLDDRLLPGFGQARVRYECDWEMGEETPAQMGEPDPETGIAPELAPAVPAMEQKTHEQVVVDYVYWKDMAWSPCRVWHDVRWVAFRALMPKSEWVKRFPKFKTKFPADRKKDSNEKADPRERAEVWEIWSKEDKKTYWYCEGMPSILDVKDDPLELESFFPCPRPMVANLTTGAFVPLPDYVLSQDLYKEIDLVSTRINALARAVRVRGLYDKTAKGVSRLLNEGEGNELIPIESWAMFAEKGGMKGAVDWFPLEMVVAALDKLREYRTELMGLLYQTTGMSDIMRGQATEHTTATEQSIKAKFASVRVQSLQDEFARFASDVQRLKAEVICKHFAPETILERSNMKLTDDGAQALQAVQMLQSEYSCYRVEVKPEAVSLTDFAALKAERTDFIQGLSGFLQAAAPAAQGLPNSAPFLLKMLQWYMQGFRGSSTIEGVLDQAIAAAEAQAKAPPQPPPPDPKLMAQQAKAQADQQHLQTELQKDMMLLQAETQADGQKRATQAVISVKQAQAMQAVKAQNPLDAMLHPSGVEGG